MSTRARIIWISALVALGCNGSDDDGTSSGAGTDSTTGSTATGGTTAATGSTTGTATDSSGPTTAGTGTTDATSTSTGGSGDTGTAGGSTTGGIEGTVLQNDSWMPGDGLIWQIWPNNADCWASVYDLNMGDYPFDIVAVQPAIGGSGDTKTFHVAIWEVNNQGEPTQEIDGADVQIEGDVGLMDIVLADHGISVPTIQNGSFATVMCHTEHMGSPSIAVDNDMTVAAKNNWVWSQAQQKWIQAPDYFGIAGDFILRTIVQPG